MGGKKAGLAGRLDRKALPQPGHKRHMRGRQRRLQALRIGMAGHIGRQHQVNAVRQTAQALLDIAHDGRNILRRIAREPQHRKAASLGNGDHDIGLVRETKDRMRYSQALAERCLKLRHGAGLV